MNLEVITMKKFCMLVLLGLCVCLISGCCATTAGPSGSSDQPEPEPPDQPSSIGTYLTWDSGPIEIYVTSRPIDGVTDYNWIEPGTGEYGTSGYYYSDMGILIPYATKWSDGSLTLSVAAYDEVDYDSDSTSEFNDTSFVSNGSEDGEADGNEPDIWYIGNAPSGRTKSDYTFDSNSNKYVYNGNTPPAGNLRRTSTADNSDDDDDTNDVNGDINENDGLNLNRR
jgi:hypothetical protein